MDSHPLKRKGFVIVVMEIQDRVLLFYNLSEQMVLVSFPFSVMGWPTSRELYQSVFLFLNYHYMFAKAIKTVDSMSDILLDNIALLNFLKKYSPEKKSINPYGMI